MKDAELWQRISAHGFDDPQAAFPFSARLARENGWSRAFALEVIEEYKRFCYLAMVAGHEVTPSDEVDQAWHLHMTYTRDYWGAFTDALGQPLHHGPTKGTSSDKARFDENYAATLASYDCEFGHPAPAAIWPPAEIRFGKAASYRRVSAADHWIVSKNAVRFSCGVAMLVLTAWIVSTQSLSAAQDNADSGRLQLWWIVVILAIAFGGFKLLGMIIPKSKRRNKKGTNGSSTTIGGCGTDGGGSGCGGGGCGSG